jgi:hypothetical protein
MSDEPLSQDAIAARMFPNVAAPVKPAPPPTDDAAAKMFPNSGPPAPAPEGPPEKYEFVVPEEFHHLGLTYDEPSHQEFSKIARSMGLSNARAQELVNFHLRRVYGKKG